MPNWIDNIIPITDSNPSKCHRYANSNTSREYSYYSVNRSVSVPEFCTKHTTNKLVRCDHDGFIYKTDEISIQNEVTLT